MRYTFTIALFTLVVGASLGVAGVIGWQRYVRSRPVPTSQTDATQVPKVTALGRIEPEHGVIVLGSPMPDRLLRFMDVVHEGAMVTEGEKLAELSSQAERQLEYRLICAQIEECEKKEAHLQCVAKAKGEVADVKERQLRVMPPLEIAQQQTKLSCLKHQVDNARKNDERVNGLSESAVSAQEREQQKLLRAQAEAEYTAAEIALDQLKKGSELKQQLARAERRAAEADLRRAKLELPLESLHKQKILAEHRLEQTTLRAPCTGEILKKCARVGELVGGQQPILQIADTSRMVVIAEVYETEIHKVKQSQPAVISSRAWPGKAEVSGQVIRIGKVVGRNRILDSDPTARVDRRVVEVTIRLDNPEPARGLIYHQVSVDILPDRSAASSGSASTGALP